MKNVDKDLLTRIEGLLKSYKRFVKDAEGSAEEEKLVYGLRGLVNLANMILRDQPIFGIEPWHVLHHDVTLAQPGEMLLRLKDYKGNPMPPYPFVMAFYDYGFTAELDAILTLAALRQFEDDPLEKQVSINVSGRSLRDPNFVKIVLARLDAMDLFSRPDECVVFEIHESCHNLAMSRQVLQLFRSVGCLFALDDVGLTMNDVMRVSEFEGLADFVKIDRHNVCAPDHAPNSLENVMSMIETVLPDAVFVAEGVQSIDHAIEICRKYPAIAYAQGLYLPEDRKSFQVDFYNRNLIAGGAAVYSQAQSGAAALY
ncbi:MAG: EAL domain-containing protein [Bdellovibrionales bacterium]